MQLYALSAVLHACSVITSSLCKKQHSVQLRVTAISPGAVKTEFSIVRNAGDVAAADAVYKGIEPLTAEDIADDVLYAATRCGHCNMAACKCFEPLTAEDIADDVLYAATRCVHVHCHMNACKCLACA